MGGTLLNDTLVNKQGIKFCNSIHIALKYSRAFMDKVDHAEADPTRMAEIARENLAMVMMLFESVW